MSTLTSPRRRGAPARIDLDTVVKVALDLVDAEGLDALSLRAVAARAGVVPNALYRHLSGVDDLFDLVVTRLVDRLAERHTTPDTWEEGLRLWASEVRRVMLAHPAVLVWAQRHIGLNRASAEAAEKLVMAPLRAAGLSTRELDTVYRVTYSFVIGFVSIEQGRAETRGRPARDGSVGEDAQRFMETSGLPVIAAAADLFAQPYDAAHFEAGLDMVCTMVAAVLAAEPTIEDQHRGAGAPSG